MTDFRKRFLESRDELKKVRSITLCAMLAAMGMALSYFTIRISPSFQIGFSGIANLMIGYLFGPVMAPCAGIVTDVLNYIANPNGGFYPGFTLTAIVAGFIRGAMTYHKPLTIRRLILSELIVAVVCSIFMNTLWLYQMYGESVLAGVPARVVTAVALAFINAFLGDVIIRGLSRAGVMPQQR